MWELKIRLLHRDTSISYESVCCTSFIHIFQSRKKIAKTSLVVHRSFFSRAHFRVDQSRRRRTVSTRIVYESPRWGLPSLRLTPLGSSSSRAGGGSRRGRQGDGRVSQGELVCQFLPAYPTTGNDHRSCSLRSRPWQSSIFIIFRVHRFLSFQYH